MATVNLAPIGNGFQFFNTTGQPLNGGLIYTYQAGSSTPLATYTDYNGLIANTNPIVLGTDGRPPSEIWLLDGYFYKFILKDSSLNTIGTYDNLYGSLQTVPVTAPALPSGAIILWSGSIGSIPAGYYLCNGLNGTPDLRDRFVVGAGSTYAVNSTGGSADSIVVTHNHTFTTASAGAHQHLMWADETGSGTTNPTASNYSTVRRGTGTGGSDYTIIGTSTAPTLGLTSSAGAHTHTGTTDNSGTSGTNANLPPYFALCYIMKS